MTLEDMVPPRDAAFCASPAASEADAGIFWLSVCCAGDVSTERKKTLDKEKEEEKVEEEEEEEEEVRETMMI
jgi:hypothetical protein